MPSNKLLTMCAAAVCGVAVCTAAEQRTTGPASLSITERQPDQDESGLTLVRVLERLLARQDYKRAQEFIQDALAKKSADRITESQLRYMRAKIDLDQGRYAEGAIWLNAWLESFPELPDAPKITFILGQTYRQIGALERARDAFYKTLTYTLAKATVADDEKDGAVLGLKMGLTRAAMWEVAETEYELTNWKRAYDIYGRFIEQNPDADTLVESAIYRQADCKFQMRDSDEAIRLYREALAIGPMHPFAVEAWLRLVGLYTIRNDALMQRQAINSFIWTAENFHTDKVFYWQQRCAMMLADLLRDDRAKLNDLLASIPSDASDKGWAKVRSFLQELLARKPEPGMMADSNEDDWSEWRREFEKRQHSLEARMDDALRYMPPPSHRPAHK